MPKFNGWKKVTGACQGCMRCPATSEVEAIGKPTRRLCHLCVERWWADWHRERAQAFALAAVA